MNEITVKGIDIKYQEIKNDDFICLTDIAKYKTNETDAVIGN